LLDYVETYPDWTEGCSGTDAEIDYDSIFDPRFPSESVHGNLGLVRDFEGRDSSNGGQVSGWASGRDISSSPSSRISDPPQHRAECFPEAVIAR
jgi:hypothetical protein